MRIKIAVTDACIFIDLYDLGLVASFFNLEIEINTKQLVAANFIFQNNKPLVDEMQKRLKLWGSD